MQLGRVTPDLARTVAEDVNHSASDSAPLQSLTGVAQHTNPDLAPFSKVEAQNIVEAVTQLNSNATLYPIPHAVPPTADPLGSHGPLQFRPVTLTDRGDLGVVLTEAGGAASSYVARARTEAGILDDARKAGLSPDEVNRLQQILDDSPDFKADAALLKGVLKDGYLTNSNADRAVRTFMDLDQMRHEHPDRITLDVVSSLVEGVAKSKSPNGEAKWEGVLGENAADRAAQALIAMPQGDYNAIKGMLNQAGHGGDPAFDDPGTERALILKAVAARAGQYEHPTVNDSLFRPETLEIQTFANQIRGMDWKQMVQRTTVASDGNTLEQRYSDSCSAATAQIARAEADPIYAWKLHDENVDSRDLGGFIGNQQAQLMMEVGGNPVTFAQLAQLDQMSKQGGMAGAVAKAMENALEKSGSNEQMLANQFVSDVTGQDYQSSSVDNSASGRAAAADRIAQLASQGIDVPISVNWEDRDALNPSKYVDNGLSHSLLITDVRGHGADQMFVVADPGSGLTYEVSRADLIAGQDFGLSKGRLSGFLS